MSKPSITMTAKQSAMVVKDRAAEGADISLVAAVMKLPCSGALVARVARLDAYFPYLSRLSKCFAFSGAQAIL
jgi:hypothetical protein